MWTVVRRMTHLLKTVKTPRSVLKDNLLFDTNIGIRYYYDVSQAELMGMDYLRNTRLNKGLAFTLEERQALGIQGLQPACFLTQDEQMVMVRHFVNSYKKNLNKYLYLMDLYDRNERLFYRLLSENVELLMPIVYTPTVGLACQKYGVIYRRPRGLYITIHDKNHVLDVLKNWPEPDVKAIVITDGERILGLGDLGACGMGIPVGKLALYTVLGGIKPHHCLPVLLDVGTNNEVYLKDPMYIGLRQRRVRGQEYDELVEEFMVSAVARFGQHVLIQFEDFGNANAFRLLDKYKETYCTFNDDIQGTASVSVAGILASTKITGTKISDHTFLFLGAGEAATGIATLCVQAMVADGVPIEDARDKIWMFDLDGLLTSDRPEGSLHGPQLNFAKNHPPEKNFRAIVEQVKPSVLIGASAAPKTFTPEILKAVASYHKRPIIFALSNPTSRAECTAEEAYRNTDGRAIFASGSPFGKVEYNGKEFYPGQGNNAYIFPGLALGVILAGIYHITDELFLLSAQTCADMVTEEDINKGSVYPPLSIIKDCSVEIAEKILYYAYDNGLHKKALQIPDQLFMYPYSLLFECLGIATVYPEPENKREYVVSKLYNYNYSQAGMNRWRWPQLPKVELMPFTESPQLK